ncbi:hypothetical protein SAMN05216503_1863 [Polaribacter sp. KT25b]|uniref:hypothetical protein n=1 Tax=Polaribacter sp. KT25b TaxID=1855336 RepID=UPI00087C3FEB|nr:hypothetical protein [Polaribacter sp. KT25b]SDS06378.1 hypothetical protein SAMN05216503_1863 [Polaribacter sp. KT25b]
MVLKGLIFQFPKEIKLLIVAFVCTLSIGFYSGISFVRSTTNANPTGIEHRYLGNEEDESATKMMFKKSEGEIMTTVHSHILSLSVIFFIISLLLSTTDISQKLKLFLMIEPFFSLIFTFGGIYLLWKDLYFMKYVIMISGFFMTATYTASIFIILKQALKKTN